mmetsp:Transcript_13864/g.34939  ORF Transcript_13864/g.34939 Transcript_13864/m.34939 type:complete len:222 (-) Transcript_13864:70-735(-)
MDKSLENGMPGFFWNCAVRSDFMRQLPHRHDMLQVLVQAGDFTDRAHGQVLIRSQDIAHRLLHRNLCNFQPCPHILEDRAIDLCHLQLMQQLSNSEVSRHPILQNLAKLDSQRTVNSAVATFCPQNCFEVGPEFLLDVFWQASQPSFDGIPHLLWREVSEPLQDVPPDVFGKSFGGLLQVIANLLPNVLRNQVTEGHGVPAFLFHSAFTCAATSSPPVSAG